MLTLTAALAVLIGVPSFIAGWIIGGFHDLKRLREVINDFVREHT